VDSTNVLGEYLRARRQQVSPKDVGIAAGGIRRVPGLRREEVATQAGISADYYLRLEQGRDRNPSAQVLDALARALRLDEAGTAHLMRLGGHLPPPVLRDSLFPHSIAEMIEDWPTPAYVANKFMDVLAANQLITALSPNYRVGNNMMRAVFLDPAERRLRRDWEDLTEETVAVLRANAGPDLDDPRLVELVDEMSAASDRFRMLWSSHTVRRRPSSRVHHLTHPAVGELELIGHKLVISGTDGLILIALHPAPGSRDRLNMLAAAPATH
jgi:transcriptional regulator with XRE-family HTH domain